MREFTLASWQASSERQTMHFFYLDESGDTGHHLAHPEQPVFALGGISVNDESWITTQASLADLIRRFFGDEPGPEFELHTKDLLSPSGEGAFSGRSMADRSQLALDALRLVCDRGHKVHYIAIDKLALSTATLPTDLGFDARMPWLLAYDYLITYINAYVRDSLGQHTRGMVIHDQKTSLSTEIEAISHRRRFEGPSDQRVKWVVEFSYPVDSRKNPMIQLSDLVLYCIRRFVELEHGYRDHWPDETKSFYAECYGLLHERIARKNLVERPGRRHSELNDLLADVRRVPQRNWANRWSALPSV